MTKRRTAMLRSLALVVRGRRRAALIAAFVALLAGCTSAGTYTFRNPATGDTAQCEKSKHWLLGGLSPWGEGIDHAVLMECVDKLKARGFTEQVFE